MNTAIAAIGLTSILLLLIFTYSLFIRQKSNQSFPVISQAMLQYRYSTRKKYSRKLNVRTQSKSHYDKSNLKVIIFDNNAYWIKDNIFYSAPMIDQFIDKENVEQVDTINMDKVQLDKMLFIMDKLREGINDESRGSRD